VKPLVLLPLVSCLIYTVLATMILVRDSRHPASRLAAAVCACASWWALCEALWTTATDPAVVLALVKLSSLGWIPIGPVLLHLLLHVVGHPARRVREHPLMPTLYGVAALFLALDLTTPLLHPSVVETSWGWAYVVGPLFPAAYAMAALPILSGIALAARSLGDRLHAGERRQLRSLLVGVSIPLLIASYTDGLLPILGHAAPRLGTTSVTILMGAIAWGFHRHGYSLLAPSSFAWEILATIHEGVALIRADGRIRVANPGLQQLLGASPRELDEHRMQDLFGVEPDLETEIRELERQVESLSSGEKVPVSLSTSTLFDKAGEPIGLVLVVRDLREVASLRSRLVLSDRLAAVGQLAAGIAHEINNPVAYVRSNLAGLAGLLEAVESKLPGELAAALEPELGEGRELVAESTEGVDRVAAIVRDVREFSHSGGAEPAPVDLQPLLASVLRVADPQRPAGCEVESALDEVPAVLGSAQELKQVFLNLVINAFQSCAGDSVVKVSLSPAGAHARVLVEDTGCGIAPETLERIFDPFFTTKPVGEGTGLGLSISYQIVSAHDGELTVSSTPGEGTIFRVLLPLA